MIGFTFFVMSPLSYWRAGGWPAMASWAFAINLKIDNDESQYFLRLRLLGCELGLCVQNTFVEENRKIDANDQETQDNLRFIQFMRKNGVKICVSEPLLLENNDKSFLLPGDMDEIKVELGDKILFGDEDEHTIVTVTGFREQEDGQVRYFYTMASLIK